jgi:hypothetical protein
LLCLIIVVIYVTSFPQFYPHAQTPLSVSSCLLPRFVSSYCTKRQKCLHIVPWTPPEENLMVDWQMQVTGDSLKSLKFQTSRPNSMREKLYYYVTSVLLRHDNSYRLPNHTPYFGRTLLMRTTEQPERHVRPDLST